MSRTRVQSMPDDLALTRGELLREQNPQARSRHTFAPTPGRAKECRICGRPAILHMKAK